jgi:UTP--glucose-1-phosphate uridylyltransferase
MKIRKAVIAAAGMGTRFLPQTKAMPKEMLPIIDKPIIQKIVEDAVSAGVEDIIIVTSSQKRAIEDHFDVKEGMEQNLREKGKIKEADELNKMARMANFAYIRQKGEHYGNAVPLVNAAHLLSDEPFFYFFADDYFESVKPAAVQMLEAFEASGKSILPLIEIDKEQSSKYGIVETGKEVIKNTFEIKSIIEKPTPQNAPSNLASVHGYLFSSEILELLDEIPLSAKGELEIQWAIDKLAKDGRVCGVKIDGSWQDAGNKEGYVYAIVESALANKTLGPKLRVYLENRLRDKQSDI